jgi:transcriptional regulator with XRE-family HTH domain
MSEISNVKKYRETKTAKPNGLLVKGLLKVRMDHNLTQKEMADKCVIALPTYVNYEKGVRDIPSGVLLQISKTFSVSIDEILSNSSFCQNRAFTANLPYYHLDAGKDIVVGEYKLDQELDFNQDYVAYRLLQNDLDCVEFRAGSILIVERLRQKTTFESGDYAIVKSPSGIIIALLIGYDKLRNLHFSMRDTSTGNRIGLLSPENLMHEKILGIIRMVIQPSDVIRNQDLFLKIVG